MRRTIAKAWAIMLLLVTPTLAPAITPAIARAQATPGVYTDSQATRGQLWFESQCASCHPSRDMSSADFQLKWRGRTAWDLFDRISNSMPQSAPGSLSRRTYADIVAYLLRLNGVAAGSAALTADTTKLSEVPLAFGGPPSTHATP